LRPAPRPHKPADAPLGRFCLVLHYCPVPADLTAFGLPVLGRCGRLRDRINPRTLHSSASVWCSGPSADRRCALTALALRSFQNLARSRSDLASFGRPGSRAVAQSAPRPHEDADAPLSCAMVARLAASHLLRRRQAAAGDQFLFGRRDSPSASLRTRHASLIRALALETAARIPGRRMASPYGRVRPVGRSENQKDHQI